MFLSFPLFQIAPVATHPKASFSCLPLLLFSSFICLDDGPAFFSRDQDKFFFFFLLRDFALMGGCPPAPSRWFFVQGRFFSPNPLSSRLRALFFFFKTLLFLKPVLFAPSFFIPSSFPPLGQRPVFFFFTPSFTSPCWFSSPIFDALPVAHLSYFAFFFVPAPTDSRFPNRKLEFVCSGGSVPPNRPFVCSQSPFFVPFLNTSRVFFFLVVFPPAPDLHAGREVLFDNKRPCLTFFFCAPSFFPPFRLYPVFHFFG